MMNAIAAVVVAGCAIGAVVYLIFKALPDFPERHDD